MYVYLHVYQNTECLESQEKVKDLFEEKYIQWDGLRGKYFKF